jgi:acetyl esterase/lipase
VFAPTGPPVIFPLPAELRRGGRTPHVHRGVATGTARRGEAEAIEHCHAARVPTPDTCRIAYGDHPSQFGELTLPAGAPRAVVVVIHGGFWRQRFGLELGRPLAADLASGGYAAWNIEYRRVGGDGGWPATFDDVAAAVDVLAGPAAGPLPLDRVVAVGHSAGGQLATWLAARPGLPADAPGAAPVVRLRGVVSQAGVLDLVDAQERGVGSGAPADLLGGGPDEVPDRYSLASPVARLPIGVPVVCVHGTADVNVPIRQSERFVAAAGDAAELVTLPGADHFAVIDPAAEGWRVCREAAQRLAGGGID